MGSKVFPIDQDVKQARADQSERQNEQAGIDPHPLLPLWSGARDSPQPHHRAQTNPYGKCVHDS